jgi:hypothetical protein
MCFPSQINSGRLIALLLPMLQVGHRISEISIYYAKKIAVKRRGMVRRH